MCGRYAVTVDPATLAAELGALDEVTAEVSGAVPSAGGLARERDGGDVAGGRRRAAPGAWAPNYNVAPTSPVLTVVARRDDAGAVTRRVRRMRWGLVPHWAKDVGRGPVLFNARAETVAQKASFRAAFAAKRCLVPMDGWYEWTSREAGGLAGSAGGRVVKQPHYLCRADGGRLYMAGLWSAWRDPAAASDPGAEPLLSCTVLTTDAVGPLRRVHDRMPLILGPGAWDRWLDPDQPGPAELLDPPGPAEVGGIEIRTVRPLVNSVRNNGPELVAADDAGTEPAALF